MDNASHIYLIQDGKDVGTNIHTCLYIVSIINLFGRLNIMLFNIKSEKHIKDNAIIYYII